MDLETFAAQRAQRLVDTDEYLRPVVEDGLARLLAGDPDWDEDIVAAADIVWFENHQAEAPGAGVGQGRSRFRANLHQTLDHTTDTGFEVDQAQVDRITNWLSTYAVNAGTTAGAFARGVRYKRWTAMDDQHTRESHNLADGQLRPIGSTFTVGGAKLAFPGDPTGPLDEVMNCFPAETGVRGLIEGASRRWYRGQMVTVVTEGGELTGTPNHPILTDRGWVPLGEIAESDNLVRDLLQIKTSDGEDIDAHPATIGEVFDALAEVGEAVRVAGLAVNFHGERPESEVEVVGAFGLLRDGAQTPADEFVSQLLLPLADASAGLLQGASRLRPLSLGDHAPAHRLVRGGDPGGVLLGSSIGLHEPVRFRIASSGSAGADKEVVNGDAVDAQLFRQAVLGLPGEVALDHVLMIRQEQDWSGHVYNLSTETGAFSANNFIVHNCRCVVMPASREGEAMSTNTYVIGPDDAVTYGHDEPDDDNPDVIPGEKFPPVLAAAVSDPTDIAVEPADETELVEDIPEDGEELITEIPVHGVSIVEGRATGDGRGFRKGALQFDDVPQPLGYEFEHGHGSDNSRVAIVGRIDEIFRVEGEDVNEIRWRGSIILSKEHAHEALESIMDGSYNGSSVIIDDVVIDMEEEKAAMRAQLEREDSGELDLVDEFLGDGTTPVTWVSTGRQRRLDMVPTGAFIESRIGLGHAFEDELTDADRAILASCGCDGSHEAGMAGYEEAFKDYDAEARKRMAKAGTAMPDGSFPIADEEDLRNAIQSIGRASDPDAAKAHIKKRARALGKGDLIPEGWSLDYAPGTKDGPGWITHPIPTARIRRYWVKGEGAAKIGWGAPGDFNRCRTHLAKYVQNPDWLAGLCANMHKEALGIWPAQHDAHRSGTPAPAFSLVASGGVIYPAEYFQPPAFDRATPLTIDKETRRIYGHLAEWTSCHIGIQGLCTAAPHSTSGYAYFLKGVTSTTEGDIRTGVLTHAIGHAGERMSAAAATAHYDKTDAVFAQVNVGEDEFGIWYAGVIPERVTDQVIDEVRAVGAISGDWRADGWGPLELRAAVSVPVPGYQLPRLAASAGHQTALVAAGVVRPAPKVVGYTLTLSEESVAAITRNAIREMRHQEKVAAKLEPARARVRAERLAAARSRVGGK